MAEEIGAAADGQPADESTAAPYDPMPPVESAGESMSFPGVFKDGPDEDREEKPAPAAAEKVEGEQPKVDESKPVTADKPKLPPGVQPDGKVVLGGREFRDIGHANQAMSTVFGMFKAGQTKVVEAAERADHNLRAANAWQAEAERLRAQLEAGAAPAKEAPTASKETAQDDVPEIDWDLYEAIVQDHGIAKAQRWLHAENLKVVEALAERKVGAVRSEVDQRFQPLAEEQAQVEHAREVQTMLQRVQTYTYPDGSKAYPELEFNGDANSPEGQAQLAAIGEIGEILRTYVPEQVRVSDQGVHMAVLIYRDTQARTNAALKAFAPSASTTVAVPHNPSAAAVGDASAAPVVRPQSGPRSRADQVIAEMDSAGATVSKWGFGA